MEGNYPSGFYNTEREQQEANVPLQQQQQHQHQQQHQQHATHYPVELPIPYHTSSQHQAEFVSDQPLRTFPISHPTSHMLGSIYNDSAPVLHNSSLIPHAHQHPPVTFGGHGVKLPSVHQAPPITTHESDAHIARHVLPITTPESVEENNIQPITTQEPDVQRKAPQPEGRTPVAQAPSRPIQSKEQCIVSPPTPTTSSEKPQLLAALNLKKNCKVQDLPSSLSVRLTSQNKVEGVFAKEQIEKGAEFGSYKGTLVDEDLGWSKETSWEVCMSDRVFYIDGCKDWMSHLRCAQSEEEQNMEAFQYYGKIYFKSTKVIEPGSELKVFYSEEYGKHVGIKTRLKDLTFNQDAQKFQCSMCEGLFTSAKLILRHIRCEHTSSNPDEMIPVLTWKKKKKRKYVEPEVRSKKQVQTMKKVDQGVSNFKCGTCKKVFVSAGRLKAHEVFHIMMDESKPFECSECNQRYTAQSSLKRHVREAHDNIQRIRIRKGNRTQMNRSKLRVKHGSNPYKCSECNQRHISLSALKRHESKSHGFPCQFCSERFSREDEHSRHERTHQAYKLSHSNGKILESEPSPDEPRDMLGRPTDYYTLRFKCRFCPKRYSARSSAKQHEREAHTGEGTFKCTYCPKVYAIESRLKEHLVVHKYVPLHQCTLCPRGFASESALNNHQGEHTGLKPFKCDICGRGFRMKSHFQAHKRRMHQERPMRFFCSVCNKGFTDKGNLTKHERRHKGIRQFVCLECGKGFTAKHTLAAHTQTMHTKERPFSCQICSKTFSLNHHYNHHMAKYHTEVTSKQSLEDDGST